MSEPIVKSVVDEIPVEIFNILDEIGIAQDHLGYNYLAYGIYLASQDISVILPSTKILYPAIAKVFKTTWTRAERCMRSTIKHTFSLCEDQVIQKYFGNSIDKYTGLPTVTQFIYAVARSVHRLLLVE